MNQNRLRFDYRDKLVAWCEGTMWGTLYRAALAGADVGIPKPPTLEELRFAGAECYERTLQVVATWRRCERWAIVLTPEPFGPYSSPGIELVRVGKEVLLGVG